MGLLKYNNYISEKVIYDLILESKLVYSKKFVNFLSKMKDNPIAKKLIGLYSKDINLQHNYVDVGTEKDSVSFTPDRKVKEIEKDKPEDAYKVVDAERYLTNSNGNNRIYELLGYTKKEEVWSPTIGTLGIIVKEVVSSSSGKIYVWFKGIQEWEGKETVLNKEAVEEESIDSSYKIWSTSRNNIKVGRLVRAILTAAKETFTDKDIEDFVNLYKATYDIMANALIRFDIVEGDKIAYWYNYKQYAEREGILGNSCMADVSNDYFDIYCNNSDSCKLLILYDDNGQIDNGKYVSDKIIGRCLLWKTSKIDGVTKEVQVMDRIYTIKDSDVELFKEYGKKNGIYWKRLQDSDNDFTMENGSSSEKNPSIIIELDSVEYDEYPYLDTFFYVDTDSNYITNDGNKSYDRTLRDTCGGYD